MRFFRLDRINTLLLAGIILINCYVLMTPLFPAVSFWWRSRDTSAKQELAQRIAPQPRATGDEASSVHPDSLIIPSMLLDAPVHQGATARTLRDGLWLRPQGSTPDRGGNTVIVGHRFTYTQPEGTLYHLNKVTIGEEIGLYWRNTLHRYIVTEIAVVKAHDMAIEAPTSDARLTIYTCTPLWLPKDRLVVIAEEVPS